MCDPVTIMAAASATQAVTGFIGTGRAAKMQDGSIRDALQANQQALNVQELQIGQQGTQRLSERAQQATLEQGRLRALAAETGMNGRSQDRLMGVLKTNASEDFAAIDQNTRNATAQSELQKQGLVAHAQGDSNSVKRANPFDLGLQLAMAGANAYVGDPKRQLKIT